MSQGILVSQFSTGMQKFIKINGIDRNNNGVIEIKDELPNLKTELSRIGGKFVDSDGTESLLGYNNPKWGGKPSHSYDFYPNGPEKEQVAFIYDEEKEGSLTVRSYSRATDGNGLGYQLRGTIHQTDGKVTLYGGEFWEDEKNHIMDWKYYDGNGNEIKGMRIDYRF